jgi:TPR repeat protein
MSASRQRRLIAASVVLCLALPSHGQVAIRAAPLEKMSATAYGQLKDVIGVVLLSVNWNPRANCSGFDDARLLSLSFDRGPDARADGAPGDLVVDEPMPGTADYAFVVVPGQYALSGFDIGVAKSPRERGGFRAARSRLIKNALPLGGGFEVRAGEVVYIGDFSIECRSQPIPWRSFPEGPAEFQAYLGRIKPRFPSLDLGKAQFRPMVTSEYGPFYAAIPSLHSAAQLAELTKKAEAGDMDAQYQLGAAYDAGRDVPRDLAEAIVWYRRAAQAGQVEAQNSVGSALQAEGRYAEAIAWYEKAAARGHSRSISNLAALYDAGLGVPRDRSKAIELWSRAAEFGWAEAMWNLANLYRTAAPGERNLAAACAWNVLARNFAQPFERALLARINQTEAYLEANLLAGEHADCRKLAAQWAPRAAPPRR